MKLIVAVDENWAIGNGGDQLCYIPQDLKRFRQLTMGHPVLLGRKTLATFPGGRPLKNRRNLILSKSVAHAPEGAEVYSSLEKALEFAPEDTFVIGGESIYRQALAFCDTAYVTKIHRTFPADRYFPNLEQDPAWKIISSQGPYTDAGFSFSYITYQREIRQHEI